MEETKVELVVNHSGTQAVTLDELRVHGRLTALGRLTRPRGSVEKPPGKHKVRRQTCQECMQRFGRDHPRLKDD